MWREATTTQVSGRTQAKKTAAPEDCYLEVSSLVHMRNRIDSYSPIQGLHVELYIVIFTYTYHIYIWYMWLAPTQLYENVDIFTPLMTHTHLITFLYKPGWTLLVARAHRSRCSSCVSCNVPLVRRLLSTWGEFPMSSCHWSGHQEDGNTKWNAGTISPKSELASQKEQFDSSTSSKLGVTWWFHFSVHFTIIPSYFNSGVSVTFLDVSFGCSGNLCDTWRIPDAKTWR